MVKPIEKKQDTNENIIYCHRTLQIHLVPDNKSVQVEGRINISAKMFPFVCIAEKCAMFDRGNHICMEVLEKQLLCQKMIREINQKQEEQEEQEGQEENKETNSETATGEVEKKAKK